MVKIVILHKSKERFCAKHPLTTPCKRAIMKKQDV
jgi:hypothetical protein